MLNRNAFRLGNHWRPVRKLLLYILNDRSRFFTDVMPKMLRVWLHFYSYFRTFDFSVLSGSKRFSVLLNAQMQRC